MKARGIGGARSSGRAVARFQSVRVPYEGKKNAR